METNLTILAETRDERGNFGQLIRVPNWVQSLMSECEKIGAWTLGIASDHGNRGTAVNADVYGYDDDRGLAVVQIRQCVFHPRRYNRVRKDYYLIGHNENGNAFSHPIESVARSLKAMQTVTGPVDLALSRIWKCGISDLPHVRRNGDVALIPDALPTDVTEIGQGPHMLADSHELRATRVFRASSGAMYCTGNVWLRHTKRQHEAVRAKRGGCWRVQIGIRAAHWDFSAPTVD